MGQPRLAAAAAREGGSAPPPMRTARREEGARQPAEVRSWSWAGTREERVAEVSETSAVKSMGFQRAGMGTTGDFDRKARAWMLMPPTWNVGSGQSQRSSGEARSHALTAAALARKAWRERQTMEGVEAEEPEVAKARWPWGMACGGGEGLSGVRGLERRMPGLDTATLR